jgi:hypothetical protein
MTQAITSTSLAAALLDAVRQANFDQLPDTLLGGQPGRHFPSLDVAVVAFPHDGEPVWANVLFSREHPQGVVADIGARAGPVGNIRYLADMLDAQGNSVAWQPASDWRRMPWRTLWGDGPVSVVAPYPGSLIKLMVAVGVARLVDAGQFSWDQPWTYANETRTPAAWTESMLVASNNDATSAMVALLHAGGLLPSAPGECNRMHELFAQFGLPTLRLANTRPDGGWRNADGAGVGQLQMTAWDSARLLWLLLDGYPKAPWLPDNHARLLSDPSRQRLWQWLDDQGLHCVLSSTNAAGVPGWQAGIPASLPQRWIGPDGAVRVDDYQFPPDVRGANAAASLRFAHKTGNTDNYASNAGLVTNPAPRGRRYLIALLSNVGKRYAPHPACATDWRVPRLGAAIDAWLEARLERQV